MKERYNQAEKFLEASIRKRVFHTKVIPYFNSDGTTFWYKKESPEKIEYFLVDPLNGEEKPAFDHLLVSYFLSKNLKKKMDPDHLLLEKIFFSPDLSSFTFWYEHILWHYDKKTNEGKAIDTFSENQTVNSLPSPNGKWNLLQENGNLIFVSTKEEEWRSATTDGSSSYGYGISPDTNLFSVTVKREKIPSFPIALWSPDGTKLLTHRMDQTHVKTLSLLQTCPEDGSLRPKVYTYHYPFVGDELAKEKLIIFDLEKNSCLEIQEEILVHTFSLIEMGWVFWGSDSKKIYFIKEERGAKKSSLYRVEVETGKIDLLLQEETSTYFDHGSCFFYLLEKSGQFLWLSEKEGWFHIGLYEERTGKKIRLVTKGVWNVTKIVTVDEEHGWIYFLAVGKESHRDPYYPHLYRCQLDGTELKLLTLVNAYHEIYFSPSKKVFIDNYSTLTMEIVPTTDLMTCDGKKILSLSEANLDGLFALSWQPVKRFSAKGADGTTPIYGALFFPSDFDSEKKYPVIDFSLAGPLRLNTPKSFSLVSNTEETFPSPWLAQSLAELGCIVITIDGRGTPFRSASFHHATFGVLEQEKGLDDHVHVIKELASEHFYLDLEKVGIIGHGSGGYTAVRALITHPEFYKAAVSLAGDHDLLCYLAYFGEKYQGLYEKNKYLSQSNVKFAHKIEGKLLLIHGELDDNVHPCSTLRLVDALVKAGKDFDFFYMPNENHFIYQNRYCIRKIEEFFVKNLDL